MRIASLAGFLMVLAAASLSSGATQAQTLNWVTYKPQGAGDPQAVTTLWFADEVNRRTGGKFKVRIH